jgi:uncharacterized membrane protein SirB2
MPKGNHTSRQLSRWIRLLPHLIFCAIIAVGIVLIIRDWRQALPLFAFQLAATLLIATILFVPTFLFLSIRTLSLKRAFTGAAKVWLDVLTKSQWQ